uniref:Tetrapyrrole biosynthesis uroporphyrinogen III synthase domain-containing protein n=1 Tax=Timema cristinae TaxID=61476 RepID=A0A7R9HA67_TIMCR|nr:unnamed protein product [Timema cristinae]
MVYIVGQGISAQARDCACPSGSYARPLLFPCGSLKRDTLPRQLTEKGIAVHMVTVYKTLPHPQLESNLRCIINFEEAFPEYIVYFSPSGLKFSLPTLEKLEVPLHQFEGMCFS